MADEKKQQKTTQLGLRIDVDQLKAIEKLSEFEGIDKMSWIRRALAEYIDEIEDEMDNAAIEDYVHLRISEEELKKDMEWKKVPDDLKQARAESLKFITNKRKERK